jgi:hypothetical protein
MFIVTLATGSIMFIALCQQLHVVNNRPHIELCALLAIRILIAKSSTRWGGIFKGLSQDGRQTDFPKISAPHPLMPSYQSILLSARYISLECTFIIQDNSQYVQISARHPREVFPH